MIKFAEEAVVLNSRLGTVGTIQMFDLWEDIETVEKAKTRIADIATLSYGLDWAKNPLALYEKLSTSEPLPHISCLEFIPCPSGRPLPQDSLRRVFGPGMWDDYDLWMEDRLEILRRDFPAWGAKVTAPIFVLRQWMRSRTLAVDPSWVHLDGMDPWALLEMSRRYTPGKRVPLAFYGQGYSASRDLWFDSVEDEFNERLDSGEPMELARGCLPAETMTSCYIGGYRPDWSWFVKQRVDSHAQAEIRPFAAHVEAFLK